MKIIKYIITVQAVIEQEEVRGKEWARTTAEPNAPYAYTPEITKTVQSTEKIYEQPVSNLSVSSIAAIVNGLKVV